MVDTLCRKTLKIEDDVLNLAIRPYKLHCRYLQEAEVEFDEAEVSGPAGFPEVTTFCGKGRFSIPESCYIEDTGHFNSVEFNICYNQLTYSMLAQCIRGGLMDVLKHMSLEEFRVRQLSDFLIVNFSSSFKAPMCSDRFYGNVTIDKVRARMGNLFMRTTCRFEDGKGGSSHGEILFVVVNGARI